MSTPGVSDGADRSPPRDEPTARRDDPTVHREGRAAQHDLAALPGLPRGVDGPVFHEPWEAHAFAMALALHERGVYSWPEWAAALAAQIEAARARGDADLGDTYYRHWLAALEALVAAKGAGSAGELERYRVAWDRAAGRTPHGQPIVLNDEDLRG